MSACHIEIKFVQPQREYRSGETIQGVVTVEVEKKLRCRAVQLSGYWKTHGRGNTARENYFQRTLRTGDFDSPGTFEFPFEFTPPHAPLTYHGRYINIDHYVAVRADLPWARDQKCEEEFFLRVGESASEGATEEITLEQKNGCSVLAGLITSGIILLISGFLTMKGGNLWFLLGIIPAIAIAFLSLRRHLAEQRLGEVKWGTLNTCYPNEAMPSLVQVGPIGNVRILDITAAIKGVESAVSGSGTKRTTHSHILHESSEVICKNPAARRGEVLEFPVPLEFPDSQAWSLELPDNQIKWYVTLTIRLAFWPDWTQTREIQFVGLPETNDAPPSEEID